MEILHILWWGAVTIVISLLAIFVLMHITARLFSFQYKNIEDADSWQSIGPKFTIAASTLAATFSAVSVCFLIYQNAQLREAENYKLYKIHREEFIKEIKSLSADPDKPIVSNPHELYYTVFPLNRGGKFEILPSDLKDQHNDSPIYLSVNNLHYAVSPQRLLNLKEAEETFRVRYPPSVKLYRTINNLLKDIQRAELILNIESPEDTIDDPPQSKDPEQFKVYRLRYAERIKNIFKIYNKILDFTDSPLPHIYHNEVELSMLYLSYIKTGLTPVNYKNKKTLQRFVEKIKGLAINGAGKKFFSGKSISYRIKRELNLALECSDEWWYLSKWFNVTWRMVSADQPDMLTSLKKRKRKLEMASQTTKLMKITPGH